MSLCKICRLVLSNSNVPMGLISEIVTDFLGDGLFDIISFPELMDEILIRKKNKKNPLENYLFFQISELLDMHNIEEIIMFVPHYKNSENLLVDLDKRFPKTKKHVLIYNISGGKMEVGYNKIIRKYKYHIEPYLYLLCSDGRMVKILSSQKNTEINFSGGKNGHHICNPGSTYWMSLNPRRKKMIDHISGYIQNYYLKELFILHHGPDCGEVVEYHRISGKINSKRALKQHRTNMEIAWKIFKHLDHKMNIIAVYFEFKKRIQILKEYKFFLKSHEGLVQISSRNYLLNFKTFELIEVPIKETVFA